MPALMMATSREQVAASLVVAVGLGMGSMCDLRRGSATVYLTLDEQHPGRFDRAKRIKACTNLHSQIIDNFDFTIQNLTFNFLKNSLLYHFKHVSYLKYS